MLQIIERFLQVFDRVLVTTFKASILVILLLFVKFLLRNKIGARLHYLLWSVVFISLLLPWTPQSSFSLYNLAQSDLQPTAVLTKGTNTSPISTFSVSVGSGEVMANTLKKNAVIHNKSSELPNTNELPNSNEILNPSTLYLISVASSAFIHRLGLVIWICGIAILGIATIIVNRKFSRRIRGQNITDLMLLSTFEEAKTRLNVRTNVNLIQTIAVKSPSLFGLIKPRLLLPVGILEEFSPEQLDHVFVHELVHYKHKDILVNWLSQGLLILHWFNPIIWYAFFKMREDQEIACDALTLEHIEKPHSQEYAYTLIKLLESYSKAPRMASIASLSGSKSQIKRRITMIKISRNASLKWSLLGLIVVVALASVTLTNAKAYGNKFEIPIRILESEMPGPNPT